MQFTDSHIHLQDYKEKSKQKIINEMKNLQFVKAICASAHPDDWDKTATLATNDPDFIIPAFGIHPWYVADVKAAITSKLEEYLRKFPKALVGEIGLDNLKAGNKDLQEHFFSLQLDIAKKFNRPVCIHALKSDNQIEKILNNMPNKFMFHAFGGSLNFMKKILKYGGYISLSAAIKKKNNHVEILENVSLERLLIESDGPYMSDYRDIDDFASYIAKIKNVAKIELVKRVYQNFEEFCRG